MPCQVPIRKLTELGVGGQIQRVRCKIDEITYQLFPTVFAPFSSARRKYCAALNCENEARPVSLVALMPNTRGAHKVCRVCGACAGQGQR